VTRQDATRIAAMARASAATAGLTTGAGPDSRLLNGVASSPA